MDDHPQIDEDVLRRAESAAGYARGEAGELDGYSEDEIRELGRARQALDYLAEIRDVLNDVNRQTAGQADIRTWIADDSLLPDLPVGEESASLATLGRFEIIRTLGQGGFGKVLLARDPELSRLVAIKVPNAAALVSEESRRRFEVEARAAALLTHPAIVPVFECAAHGPFRFIVSAYCPGPALSGWLAPPERRVSPATAAAVVARLASAIHHAHQRGVVHRDLKPANILIDTESESATEADLPERVRITDFGLAKQASDTSLLTTEGAVVGTPAYMSPEQAEGKSEITAASDIYSLGTILYELLTGQLPFDRSSPIATLKAVVEEEPVRPAKRVSGIHRDLEAICLKCLKKQPRERYPTAFALSEDLQRWLDGLPVTARHATRLERAGRWCGRNPALAAAIALLVAGLAFATFQWRSANAQSLRAARHLRTTQETIDQLVGETARNEGIPPALRLQFVNRAVRMQDELLASEPQDHQVRFHTARTYMNLGLVLQDTGDYERAISALDKARELIEGVPAGEDRNFVRNSVLKLLAECLRYQERYDESMKVTEQLFDEAGQTPLQLAQSLASSGLAHSLRNDEAEARLRLEQSLMILENLVDKNIYSENAWSGVLRLYGQHESRLNRLAEAEPLLLKSLQVLEQANQRVPFHESILAEGTRILTTLTDVQLRLEKTDEARKHISRFTENAEFLIGHNPESLANQEFFFLSLERRGRLRILESDWDQAIAFIRRLRESVLSLDWGDFTKFADIHVMTGDRYVMLVRALLATGQTERASDLLPEIETLFDELQRRFGDHPQLKINLEEWRALKEQLREPR